MLRYIEQPVSGFDINILTPKYIEILFSLSKMETTTIIFTKTVLDGPSKGTYHLQVSLNSFQITIMNWVRNVENRERLCGPRHHVRPLSRSTSCFWFSWLYLRLWIQFGQKAFIFCFKLCTLNYVHSQFVKIHAFTTFK